MKRLAFLILCLIPTPAWACEYITLLYGTQATVDFSLYGVTGLELKVDAAHASGDTKVMKDEGAEANTTNGFTDEGQGYSIVLTATELTAARTTLYIVDQSTKVWIDHCIVISTYGNASAAHGIPDTNVATITNGAIAAADFASGAIDAAAIAADAVGASELAADAIGASEIAADAIGASELAASAIGASELATGAVDADATATDAVTEIAGGMLNAATADYDTADTIGEAIGLGGSGGGGSCAVRRD